jgi:hypothetical protein
MAKFFSRADVQQVNQKLMSQGATASASSLSATSQKIVRETKFSKDEINSAFQEARRRLAGAK